MINFLKKIFAFSFFMTVSVINAQTPGLNYQALILNSEEIQIPGTNVKENQVPLGLEDVTLRFSISNKDGVEYIEEQTVTTDENGMVSLIVGEGVPISNLFSDIVWDGKLKYLNVEIDIISNNNGFIFLDSQKILYIPHPTNGTSTVQIVGSLEYLTPPYANGDLVWAHSYGPNGNPTLMIFNGTDWVPVSDDFDPTNELGLLVAEDDTDRETLFNPAVVGDQVWNQTCGCIQVFDGTNWISTNNTSNLNVSNGITKTGDNIKLGGTLTEPTTIIADPTNTIAIKGLEESSSSSDKIVVADPTTGVLKTKSLSSSVKQQQVILTATNGQLQFTTPLPISNIDKIDVYRNGARINFVMVNATTIELEPEAICYDGDKVRIVQLN